MLEAGRGPQTGILTVRFASPGHTDAREGGRVDPPGLYRAQVSWCLHKTPRKSPRFGPCCGSDRRSGRPRAGQGSGPYGRSRPCRQPPVVGAGVPFPGVRAQAPAAGPSVPRVVYPSTVRRAAGRCLRLGQWGVAGANRGCLFSLGGAVSRASPRRPRPPSRSLVSPDGSLSLTPALRPRLMRVLGRAPPAATPASPSRRARACHNGRSASGSDGTVKLQEQLPHHCRPQGVQPSACPPWSNRTEAEEQGIGPEIPRLL